MIENATRWRKMKETLCRRPICAELSYAEIVSNINTMWQELDDVSNLILFHDPKFMNGLDGDQDTAEEFQTLIANVMCKVERVQEKFNSPFSRLCFCDGEPDERRYNDLTVALLGKSLERDGYNYGILDEDDFFIDGDDTPLDDFSEKAAVEAAKKRILRLSKRDMLEAFGTALCILLEYLDVRTEYDEVISTYRIVRGENTAILDTIKAIDEAYLAAADVDFYPSDQPTREFDRLLNSLPDWVWAGG